MSLFMSSSVGVAGINKLHDVTTVQSLLTTRGAAPGRVDGVCGPRTVGAILRFQRQFLSRPDGRVDPHGSTWRHLASEGTSTAPTAHTHQGAAPRPPGPTVPAATGPSTLTSLVPRPNKTTINHGLTAVSPSFMNEQLGRPRESYTADCQPMTNAILRRHVVSQSIGPFNVTGLRPAVTSLVAVFAQIRRAQPTVYGALGTAGMLCCRLIRGSATGVSNHSWGTAIDLKLNGVLDRRGDSKVQVGLTLIAPIFNEHGWYWGAAFRTEDAMHFEASRTLIAQWAQEARR